VNGFLFAIILLPTNVYETFLIEAQIEFISAFKTAIIKWNWRAGSSKIKLSPKIATFKPIYLH